MGQRRTQQLKAHKGKSLFAVALTAFIISPLDDMVISAIFGTALFGFGSLPFYIMLIVSSAVSVIFWKRRALAACLRRYYSIWRVSFNH